MINMAAYRMFAIKILVSAIAELVLVGTNVIYALWDFMVFQNVALARVIWLVVTLKHASIIIVSVIMVAIAIVR